MEEKFCARLFLDILHGQFQGCRFLHSHQQLPNSRDRQGLPLQHCQHKGGKTAASCSQPAPSPWRDPQGGTNRDPIHLPPASHLDTESPRPTEYSDLEGTRARPRLTQTQPALAPTRCRPGSQCNSSGDHLEPKHISHSLIPIPLL